MLFVGRIQPLKGVTVAVEALASSTVPTPGSWVVGGPSGADGEAELARVRALVADLGLEGRVAFVDPQPHHLLSTWYRAADVVVVPSRSESFGLVALEAAACGVPVVAADVGGLPTLVRHDGTGFLVEGRDPAESAARIDELLADPARARLLGDDAVERGALLLVDDGRSPAPPLRRPGCPCARGVRVSTAAVPPSPDELARCEELVESWLAQQVDQNPTVAAVERDLESGERRWIVRVAGEEKSTSTVWFHLRQRTLHAETYLCPRPRSSRRALRVPAAPQPAAVGPSLRDRCGGRGVPRDRGARRVGRRRRARPGARHRSTPRSSSASGRRCASASRPASRADPAPDRVACPDDTAVAAP